MCVAFLVNENVDVMISPGCNAFRLMSNKQIGANFKYCQIKTHVRTARESHDLNMDFRSFDNGFKQLRVTNSMHEYNFNPMYIIRLIHRYFIFICRSLVKAIGIENLQHVLDIMSMINDEQEIKVPISLFEL